MDYIHFEEFADLLSQFQLDALDVIFQRIHTWPARYKRQVQPTLVDLVEKGTLRGLYGILIFHELDRSYLPLLLKDVIPTKQLVISLVEQYCIDAIDLHLQHIQKHLTTTDIYQVFLAALRRGYSEFSRFFYPMIGQKLEGDLFELNTPHFGELVQCAVRIGDIGLLRLLARDPRFHVYNYGLYTALKDGHESTACFIIQQGRTLMRMDMFQCAIRFDRRSVIDVLFSDPIVLSLPRDSLWMFLTSEWESVYALKKLLDCSDFDVTKYLLHAIRKCMLETVYTILERGRTSITDEVWAAGLQTNTESMVETLCLFAELPEKHYLNVVEKGFLTIVEHVEAKIPRNAEFLQAAIRSDSIALTQMFLGKETGKDMLYQAVRQRSEAIFALLLSHYEGEVDLRFVLFCGTSKMLKQILESPKVKYQLGGDLIDVAQKLKKTDMVGVLQQHSMK
jgi:hypothetical protein